LRVVVEGGQQLHEKCERRGAQERQAPAVPLRGEELLEEVHGRHSSVMMPRLRRAASRALKSATRLGTSSASESATAVAEPVISPWCVWFPAAAVVPDVPSSRSEVPAPIAARAVAASSAVSTSRPTAVASLMSVDAWVCAAGA